MPACLLRCGARKARKILGCVLLEGFFLFLLEPEGRSGAQERQTVGPQIKEAWADFSANQSTGPGSTNPMLPQFPHLCNPFFPWVSSLKMRL